MHLMNGSIQRQTKNKKSDIQTHISPFSHQQTPAEKSGRKSKDHKR